ncbi:MAG: hypothetical protein QNJ98_06400 [Planctomycetota bacterium]|nr:hypothetical protein [Planctomycetota bacterium]
MSRILSIALLALGGLFALVAFASLGQLSSGYNPEWATASIADLEADRAPEADFVRIRDGLLFWPAMLVSYEEHMRTKETREKGVYVPLVSKRHGDELVRQLLEDGAADFSGVRAYVFLSQERMEDEFDGATSMEEIGANMTPYAVEGLIKPASELPSHVAQYLAVEFMSVRQSGLAYVSQGVEPVTVSSAIVSGILGFLLLLAGLRLRRHARAERKRATHDALFPSIDPRLAATAAPSAS